MGYISCLLFLSLLVVGVLFQETHQISRDDFPPGFVFGAGTASFQVEGAAAEDGRSPSIWDTFAHSGKMPDKSNFDTAADQYHRYKEDVKLMSDMGLDAYRFSFSWSRLIPEGRGAVNPMGLQYYNNLINELIAYGIEPHVTLHHLDLPQVLEDEYEGWLSPKIVKDFTAYADACFREFGDRVKYWSTLNEPNIFSMGAYDQGIMPPNRCSFPYGFHNCTAGNSSIEPYIVTHNQLLAHAEVARLYKEKYQAKQNGWIGISIYAFWMTPQTNKSEDVTATQRARDFMIGWFFNPLVFGDYPEVMKKNVGSRLPSITKTQSELVKGSFDFIGINHYTTISVADKPQSPDHNHALDLIGDMNAIFVQSNSSSSGISPFIIPVIPWGFEGLLEYIQRTYGNPPIYVHENGYGTGLNVTLNDTARVDYLNSYLEFLLKAVRNGSNTKGYFVWSFLDGFELLFGYQRKYGLIGVDFENKGLPRYPKYSAHWYTNFLKKNSLNIEEIIASAASQSIQ